MVTEAQVRKALEGVMDPELHKSLIELGMVRTVQVEEGQVDITLALDKHPVKNATIIITHSSERILFFMEFTSLIVDRKSCPAYRA